MWMASLATRCTWSTEASNVPCAIWLYAPLNFPSAVFGSMLMKSDVQFEQSPCSLTAGHQAASNPTACACKGAERDRQLDSQPGKFAPQPRAFRVSRGLGFRDQSIQIMKASARLLREADYGELAGGVRRGRQPCAHAPDARQVHDSPPHPRALHRPAIHTRLLHNSRLLHSHPLCSSCGWKVDFMWSASMR